MFETFFATHATKHKTKQQEALVAQTKFNFRKLISENNGAFKRSLTKQRHGTSSVISHDFTTI